MLEVALNHQRSGRFPEAERACGEILAIAPHHADALHLLGMIRYLQNDLVLAERLMRRSIELCDDVASYHGNLAEVCRAAGHFEKAIAECERALTLSPTFAGAHLNKGLAYRNAGQVESAITCFQAALAIDPDFDAARSALANDLAVGGRAAEALIHARELEKRAGESAEAWMNLGNLWKTLGQAVPAMNALRRSVGLKKSAAAMNDYGVLLQMVGDVLGAAHWLQQAINVDPGIAHQYSNLGNVVRDLGDWPGAIARYRRALELKPDLFVAHSNLLFTRLYDPEATGAGMLGEAREWGNRHGAGIERLGAVRAADPEKRLRIGYVSPDLREHAVGFFLEPLVEAHDRRAVEVTCYSATVRPDATTARIRAAADRWREVAGVEDKALAEMIRADGIDIVVDCAGHSHGNRLLALARRPAPVQATLILGHGGTTGLAGIDYMLSDGAITPEGMEGHFSEQVVRLPRVFAPFRARSEWPEVGPLPDGPAVFGCFADPARIDGRCVGWWRRILEAVAGSRILFKNEAYGDERMAAHWRRLFGPVAERSDFEGTPGGWGENMGAYRRVWAMLDSWPVTGATSTLIPLWMGVPVVSLAGAHAGQRFGASILAGVGLAELAAKDPEDYIARAIDWVGDRARLGEMRRTLRARVAASPFRDGPGVARDYEAAYRQMWRTRCAGTQVSRDQAPENLLVQGVAAIRQGSAGAAIPIFEAAIRIRPDMAEAHAYLGIALLMTGRPDAAQVPLERAVTLRSDIGGAWKALGKARAETNELKGAATAYWWGVRVDPGDEETANLYREAVAGLGQMVQELAKFKRYDDAVELADHVLLLDPDNSKALHDKGVIAHLRGDNQRAVDLINLALARNLTPIALCNLGNALIKLGRAAEGFAAYERCVEFFPNHAVAHFNAACELQKLELWPEAEDRYRQAIDMSPGHAESHYNLGTLFSSMGRHEEAIGCFRRALALKPDYTDAHSNLIFEMYYFPEITGEDLATEARRWGEAHGQIPAVVLPRRKPNPAAKLRIGYCSPDFRDHAASYFLEPVLRHHDPASVETYCYSQVAKPDTITARIRGYAAHWRDVALLGDEQLAALVRDDGIDILVDCAGHSRGSRLGMFARAPAPIQIGTYLGIGGTLGVPAIRHFLSDPYITPPGFERHFTETLIRMPRVFLPFQPRSEWPEVMPRVPGPTVFVCFTEPLRLSAMLLDMWRRILDRVPGSRLLLKHPQYRNPRVVAHFRSAVGPLSERADFEGTEGGWAKHWDVYGRVSVALDAFPVTGATSTAIPPWMGVPVVSLAGVHSGQRFGASILTNAGLPELLADTPEAYVNKAVELANDRDRLEDYRRNLRATMAASPLLDGPGVVRELENVYRALAREECARTN